MTFDGTSGSVLRFGGETALPFTERDTRTWNGSAWVRRNPTTLPLRAAADPALTGLQVVGQAAVLDGGPSGGFSLTHGLRAIVGQ